jgi:XTP/dITP diphosphohydrolase
LVKILIATKNKGKIREIERLLEGLEVEVLGLDSMPPVDEPVEDGTTFQENALKKATHYWNAFGLSTLAEDSGLEVFALDGQPGVYSARYAGEGATDQQNIEKLLTKMKDIPEKRRQARFVAVLCFIHEGKFYYFEGEVRGRISFEPRGEEGFGYDPVFIPEGYDRTFAELGLEVKNKLSHRARAIEKFREFLKGISQ